MNAIEMRALTKRFAGKEALVDASIEVATGTVTAVVGPTGSGKSTMLRAAAGRLRATEGSVSVLGLDPVKHAGALIARVGWVPEQATFPPGLNVRETGQLLRKLAGVGDALEFARYCAEFGLDPAESAEALTPSKNRLLSLALALQKKPRVLIVDDAAIGDEAEDRARARASFATLRKTGAAVIFASARLEEASESADQVVLLLSGRVVDRFENPAVAAQHRGATDSTSAETHELLDSIPAALPSPAEVREHAFAGVSPLRLME